MTKVINFSKQNCKRIEQSRSSGFDGSSLFFARMLKLQKPKFPLRLVGIEPNPGPLSKIKKNNKMTMQVLSKVLPRVVPHPPTFRPTINTVHVLRYIATAAVTKFQIDSETILQSLVVALSSTTSTRLFQSVRLNRISLWGPMASALTPVSVIVQWDNTTGPTIQKSDTSMGSSEPAYVTSKPPPLNPASFWASGNSDVSFCNVTGPAGMVVDLVVNVVLFDNIGPVSGGTLAGANPGQVYCRSLDSTSAGTNFVPVGYLTL
jgi:hypothetical protein